MRCSYCSQKETEVVETRDSEDLGSTRRRRECKSCGKRFTTYERIEKTTLFVVKKDGRKEEFDIQKLKSGIIKACNKTRAGAADVDRIAARVEREIRHQGALEINSRRIGQMAARELKKIDKVAYIRFASVFKRFVDLEDFEKELKKLL